jgi:hypothetical protein
MAGLVFQVMLSAHEVFVTRWTTPPLVESLVTKRRSFAELTLAPAGKPVTSKRRNACFALVLPPTAEKVLDEPKALPELA